MCQKYVLNNHNMKALHWKQLTFSYVKLILFDIFHFF